jgi:hypothetical protein
MNFVLDTSNDIISSQKINSDQKSPRISLHQFTRPSHVLRKTLTINFVNKIDICHKIYTIGFIFNEGVLSSYLTSNTHNSCVVILRHNLYMVRVILIVEFRGLS